MFRKWELLGMISRQQYRKLKLRPEPVVEWWTVGQITRKQIDRTKRIFEKMDIKIDGIEKLSKNDCFVQVIFDLPGFDDFKFVFDLPIYCLHDCYVNLVISTRDVNIGVLNKEGKIIIKEDEVNIDQIEDFERFISNLWSTDSRYGSSSYFVISDIPRVLEKSYNNTLFDLLPWFPKEIIEMISHVLAHVYDK